MLLSKMTTKLWLPPAVTMPQQAAMQNQVGVFVPVDAVFPDISATAATLKTLLSTLSRTDALIWCARLNLIVSNPSYENSWNKQLYGLHNFFSQDDIKKVAKFFSNRNGPATVFFRGQLLELIRWICLCCKDLPGDGSTFSDLETRRTFAKAALIASDLWGKRTYGDKMHLEEGVEAARRRTLGAVRLAYDAVDDGRDPLMAIGLGRTLFLDHFVALEPSFPEKFKTETGLEIEDYFGLLCAIGIHYLNRTPEEAAKSTDKSGIFSQKNFAAVNANLGSVAERYFAKFSQTADQLSAAFWPPGYDASETSLRWCDFRAIRARPLLRTSDGRSIVLDPVYFAESASAGPLFAVLRLFKNSDELFTQFGYAFERYVNSVLRCMYPAPAGNAVNRLACNIRGKDKKGSEVQIADASLNNVDELVLFESKAAWIRDEVVEQSDPEEYIRALNQKYLRRDDGQPKGAGQLANAISNLAANEWNAIAEDYSRARKVYPVLITHDSQLNAVSHAYFLALEFNHALVPDEILPNGDLRKGRLIVAPLIIVTIDTLEILERSVEHFGLIDLLRDYSKASPDRMLSLYNFLATSEYRKKLFASGSLAESVIKAIEIGKKLMGFSESNELA